MNLSLDQLRDRRAVEPSPSPPVTARVVVPPSHIHSTHPASLHSDPFVMGRPADFPSDAPPPPSSSHSRGSGSGSSKSASIDEVLEEFSCVSALRTAPPRNAHGSEDGKPVSGSRQQASKSSQPVSGARPLGNRPVNPAPVLQYKPRSFTPVPAPEFEWTENTAADRVRRSPQRTEWTMASTLLPPQQQAPSSSSSRASTRRRSSVMGPDPRDCVDLCEEVEEVVRVAPQPHPHSPQRRVEAEPQPRPPVAATVTDDLAALVNADSIDRCRSDSHGQILLVDDSCDTVEEVPEYREEEEEEEDQPLPVPSRSSPLQPRVASGRDAMDDCEFSLDYFYLPAASPNGEAEEQQQQEEVEEEAGNATPVRTAPRASSLSPSSSIPRWRRTLAEETPFTPFPFTPNCAASTGIAASPFVLQGCSAAGALGGGVEAALAEEQRRSSLLDELVRGSQQQRLTVQEVVAAVLTSPTLLRSSAVTEATRPDGPADARPAPLHDGDTTTTTNSRVKDQTVDAERERLTQRMHDVRARLAHVDQLVSRFDAVIEAREAELATVAEKHAELAQQTDSHKARAAMAQKEVRRLRDRQHAEGELHLLRDMLVDKENRLAVAQSCLLSLKRLWQQLQLLHAASLEKSGIAKSREKKPKRTADAAAQSTSLVSPTPSAPCLSRRGHPWPPSLPPAPGLRKPVSATEDSEATTHSQSDHETEEDGTQQPQEEERDPERSPSCASSSASTASSLFSLNTCDVLDDFLEELLMEVDGLAKVCIQLPSPPSAMSFCNRMNRSGNTTGRRGNHPGLSPRGRPTYSALNRRLNDGNNGFFSFFGGATEAHLNSKPLSTFLANLDRLARSSWEWEEELQLRARELATDQEEEELRARLMAEYGRPVGLAFSENEVQSGAGMPAGSRISPTSPSQPREEQEAKDALQVSEDALAGSNSADRTTRQLFLSSPEHGRRSRGSLGSPNTHNNGSPGGPLSTSPLLRHPSAVPFVLPTLVYAYPRLAAVSQHLDAEQQKIQAEYAATIEAARQRRRHITSRLREAFRVHVAPSLRRTIDALRQQQLSLARQLGELGVKAIVMEWEEEELEPLNDAELLLVVDEATAAGRRRLIGGPRRRHGGGAGRSRSRAYSAARDEEAGGYAEDGEGSYSRATSLARSDMGGGAAHNTHAAGGPSLNYQVYRRTLRVVCCGADGDGGDDGNGDAKDSHTSHPSRHHHHHHNTRAHQRAHRSSSDAEMNGAVRSARSTRERASSASGRRSSTAAVAPVGQVASLPSHAALSANSLSCQDQSGVSAVSTRSSKTCSELQLYTHSPAKPLLDLVARLQNGGGKASGNDAALDEDVSPAGGSKRAPVAPIATASQRRSGGTPRVSSAAGSSVTTRSSTTSGRTSSAAAAAALGPPSPRPHNQRSRAGGSAAASPHQRPSSRPASPRPTSARHSEGHRPRRAATACSTGPVVEDSRVLVVSGEAAAGAASAVTPDASSPAAAPAAGVWSPFDRTRNALAEGAVHVTVTFTGAEAHRRQVAQTKQEAYQRQFWQLREELARIDEDIFQLRARHTDLLESQQRVDAEQTAKIAEAEAKVRKCRAFYKALKEENREWQGICDELQRVIREGEG